jgi:Cellulose biosynthesis protein BcsS
LAASLAGANSLNPSVISADGEVDGVLTWLRGTVGYQTNAGNLRLTGNVGVDYQDYDLSPDDPGNPVNGSETGFFVSGDTEIINPKPFFFGAIGQYSTAYEWYWSRVRTGFAFGQGDYAFQKVIFGPEGIFFGNIGFDAQRAGGFLSFPVKLGATPLSITLSGGYQWIGGDDEGGEIVGGIGGVENTPYGSLSFHAVF